jgi:hypothetical protein
MHTALDVDLAIPALVIVVAEVIDQGGGGRYDPVDGGF